MPESSSDTLRRAFQALHEGVVVQTADGRVVECNPRAEELLGAAPDAMASGAAFAQLRQLSGAALAPDAVPTRRAVLTGQPVVGQVVSVPQRGKVPGRILSINAMPVLSDDGTVREVVTVISDITEQHQVNEKLRTSQSQLSDVAAIARFGTWEQHLESREVKLSPQFLELVGAPTDAALEPTTLWRLVAAEDLPSVVSAMQAAAEGGEASFQCRIVRADRGLRHLRAWVRARPNAQGLPESIFGVVQDITDEVAFSERMRTSERLASLGTLASGIAHQVNNPLAYVVSNTEAARDGIRHADMTPDELVSALTDALQGTGRIKQIVADLRAFERRESGVKAAVQLETALELSAGLASNEIRHRAQLTTSFGATRPVWAAESRLVQLFLHLLVNASRAIPDGRADSNRITLSTRMEGDSVVASVADTGGGISPDVLPRIFDAFYTTRRVGEGTGLGLFVCQGIVQELHGEIRVDSQPGKGTTFEVLLPAMTAEQVADIRTPPPMTARGRILVIDDEPFVLLAIERLLSKDHDLVLRQDARAALRLVEQGDAFDLVLCDLMMPEVNGIDVWNRLGTLSPVLRSRMVFMSGGTFTESAERFLSAHTVRVLDKPFTRAALHDVVARGLAGAGD